jgi:outer membrane protein OmpA-like peptidoglycan-associated protein/Flp pilus assembly protein TadG
MTHTTSARRSGRRHHRGAGLVETIVALPMLLLLVMSTWQAALVYRAKSSVNYAAFEAARAGSVGQASVASIQAAFQKALIPYYGGGRNVQELTQTMQRVAADLSNAAVRIQILSPTQESFADYNSPALQAQYNTNEQVIPNVGIDRLTCPRDARGCNSNPQSNASGQSLLDANLLKLRITYGIPAAKQVPLAGRLYVWALNQLGAGAGDAFKQALLEAGRIPIVTATTLRMQSDAIRNTAMVSSPGAGNNGSPVDPGPAASGPGLPTCSLTDPACGNPSDGSGGSSTPGGGSGGGGGAVCGSEQRPRTLIETGSSDVLFDFDSATINAAGRRMLDELVASMQGRTFERLTLTGFTDQIGDDAYNQRLSEQRAAAVRAYLQANGWGNRRIESRGRGEQEPLVQLSQCPNAATRVSCLARNRRVVFTFEGLRP